MFYFLILPLLLSGQVNSATNEELLKRIEALEEQQTELKLKHSEERPVVYSFLKNSIYFGGFFEMGYLTYQGPDTDLKSFNQFNFLGINLAANFGNKLKFVSQVINGFGHGITNEHHNPRQTPTERTVAAPSLLSNLSQAYIEYAQAPFFNIQAGIGYVPFGYAAQQRERVLFIRRGGPQILRTNRLLTLLWNGVNIHGSFKSSGLVGYNIYSFQDQVQPSVPGLGGRLWWKSSDDRVTAGVSTQWIKKKTDVNNVVGADLRMSMNPVLITTEFVQNFTDEESPWSAYIEPGVFVADEEFLLFLYGDYLYNSLNRTSSVGGGRDPFTRFEYGLGMNWLPTSYTRFRATVGKFDYLYKTSVIDGQDRDIYILDLSAGVSF